MGKKTIDLEQERLNREAINRIKARFEQNPGLRERTTDALSGKIPGLDMSEKTIQIPVRMPAPMLARLEALEPFVKSLPELSLKSKVSKSDLIRIAILKGIEALEKEQENR